jgi:hypothetical protein
MTIKEQLLQELNSTPDRLIVETFNLAQSVRSSKMERCFYFCLLHQVSSSMLY